MGSLTNRKIKETYPGLIKTTDEGAINGTPKALTDGMGNALPVLVGTAGMTYTGTQDFSSATLVGVPAGAKGDTGATGPTGPTGPQGAKGDTGAAGGVTKIIAGTNVTISPTNGLGDVTINATGGGGASTPPRSLGQLPQTATLPFGTFPDPSTNNRPMRTWLTTTGYTLGSISVSDTSAQWSVFSLGQGDQIKYARFYVGTAVAGSTCWAGIYRLEFNSTYNGIAPTTRLVDLGTVSSATTGQKNITLGTAFTQAAETYGAVALVVGASTSGVQIRSFNDSVWSGNASVDGDGTGIFYRNIQLKMGFSSSITSAPASLIPNTNVSSFTSDTSNAAAIWIA